PKVPLAKAARAGTVFLPNPMTVAAEAPKPCLMANSATVFPHGVLRLTYRATPRKSLMLVFALATTSGGRDSKRIAAANSASARVLMMQNSDGLDFVTR